MAALTVYVEQNRRTGWERDYVRFAVGDVRDEIRRDQRSEFRCGVGQCRKEALRSLPHESCVRDRS
jgi:hypothetical protein